MSTSDTPDTPGPGPASTASEPRSFALTAESPPLAAPLLTGFVAGLLTLELFLRLPLPDWAPPLAVFTCGTLVSAIAMWRARARVPDALLLTPVSLSLTRDGRPVTTVDLPRLRELNEVQTAGGPVLVLGDASRTIAIVSSKLRAGAYLEFTDAFVAALSALDPTGALGQRAVEAGRERQSFAERPVRATWLLVLLLLGAAFAASQGLAAMSEVPFALERFGALGGALVSHGEKYRLVSYAFLHPDNQQLLLAVLALLWVGTFVERAAGYELLVVSFVGGVVTFGVVVVASGFPGVVVGSGGGLIALLGSVAALVVSRRLPAVLRPRAEFWLLSLAMAAMLVLLQPLSLSALHLAPADYPWSLVLAHAAAFLAGLLVTPALLLGTPLPVDDTSRARVRPFAGVAVAALVVGLAGGASHPHRGHDDDAALLANAFVDAPVGPRLRAILANHAAYTLLFDPAHAGRHEDVVATLAERAVADSESASPEILDTLAVVRYRQGRQDEAIVLMRQALDLLSARDTTDPARKAFTAKFEQRLDDISTGRALSP